MWCDNCLLLFPLRAGAVVLAVFMALFEIVGAIILWKYGSLLFFNPPDYTIYAGFAAVSGVVAIIAAIAISNRSYLFTRLLLFLYPILLFIAAIRGALMSWELQHWEYRITGECQHVGSQWVSDSNYTNPDGTLMLNYSYNGTSLPTAACNLSYSLVSVIIACVALDFIMMLYLTFLIWRCLVKLRHYPVQKGTVVDDGAYYT